MMLMLISISPALVLLLDQMLVDLLQKSLPHLRMEKKDQNHDGEDHNDHDGQDEKAMMMMITTYMLCH